MLESADFSYDYAPPETDNNGSGKGLLNMEGDVEAPTFKSSRISQGILQCVI